jgi:hypothetical protein
VVNWLCQILGRSITMLSTSMVVQTSCVFRLETRNMFDSGLRFKVGDVCCKYNVRESD